MGCFIKMGVQVCLSQHGGTSTDSTMLSEVVVTGGKQQLVQKFKQSGNTEFALFKMQCLNKFRNMI